MCYESMQLEEHDHQSSLPRLAALFPSNAFLDSSSEVNDLFILITSQTLQRPSGPSPQSLITRVVRALFSLNIVSIKYTFDTIYVCNVCMYNVARLEIVGKKCIISTMTTTIHWSRLT